MLTHNVINLCTSPPLLDATMATLASPACQEAPASSAIAMVTWIYPYLTAVIQ